MAKPSFVPLRPTPRVVSTGTLSKPTGNGPKPALQAPLLSRPSVKSPNKVTRKS